jgi:hypothetical protein
MEAKDVQGLIGERAMPIIECSCGMFMSLSSAEPRTRCIRCGGVEFRFVEKWAAVHEVPVRFVPRRSTADRADSSRELAAIALAATEPTGEGAYI